MLIVLVALIGWMTFIVVTANMACSMSAKTYRTTAVVCGVGITNKLMGVPPWRAIASIETF